jgi:O-antigen/teichoic acid export membrane protein
LVGVVLGDKWQAMAGLVTIMALAMPAYTLHILFAPAINALGHARITVRCTLFGAVLMPIAFVLGLQWGMAGLAWSWVIAFPLVPLVTFLQARGKLGINAGQLAAAVAPGLLASMAMAVVVFALGRELGSFAPWLRLVMEIGIGAAAYAGLLFVFSRGTLVELSGLVFRRRPDPAAAVTG